jgi:sugar/nucleoside kinase (ribokinase family)
MKSIWTMGELLVEIMRPRAGMPLGRTAEFLGPFPSGAPAIFIDTVARLGIPAGIIGGVGEDDFGHCLLDRLETDGVDCSRVMRVPYRSTAVAFVTYSQAGSRQFIFHIEGTPASMAEFSAAEEIEEPAFFHIMGCSLMVNDRFRENILRAMVSFHERGTSISFDPNLRPELLGGLDLKEIITPVLQHCSVIFPGKSELALITGKSDIQEGIDSLFEEWPLETVVVKLGRYGSTIYTRSTGIGIPPYPVKEVDPTGAGDCFDAAFLCGVVEGLPIEECGRLASAAGALNAAAFGPMEGQISRKAVKEVMDGHLAG